MTMSLCATFTQFLNGFRDIDSTTSLGSLCHCLTALAEKESNLKGRKAPQPATQGREGKQGNARKTCARQKNTRKTEFWEKIRVPCCAALLTRFLLPVEHEPSGGSELLRSMQDSSQILTATNTPTARGFVCVPTQVDHTEGMERCDQLGCFTC